MYEKLEKSYELKEKGILTEEEFAIQKEKILNENKSEQVEENKVEVVVSKSKILAGLLAIFLGVFGIHNFYLGYTGKAIAQLLITILSFGLLAFISAIWGLIEGILIFTEEICKDSEGNKLV